METEKLRDRIDVWRPHDLAQLELRRGFRVGAAVPRHWHEEYQFVLGEAGAGELVYRGSTLATPPASLFMVHPGEVHANRSLGGSGCSYRTLFVDPELMRGAAAETSGKDRGLPFFPTAVVFDRRANKRFLDLHVALERPSSSLERQALLLDLLAGLIVRYAESRASPRRFGREPRGVARAREFLTEHYAENVSLERLAAVACLSPFHFNRAFSEQLGMPPHAFQVQVRVARAKALLRRGWSIGDAASQTGFADQSHLTRHFKRLVGVTPGRYVASCGRR